MQVAIVDKSPNQIPAEIEKTLKKLEEGQKVYLTINPARQKTVTMVMGNDDPKNRPKEERVTQNGFVGLTPNRFMVRAQGHPNFLVGFSKGLSDKGEARWFTPRFNQNGTLVLSGDNSDHAEYYKVAQMHPGLKDGPFAKKNNPEWLFKFEVPGESETDQKLLLDFEREDRIRQVISLLDKEQLSVLVSGYNSKYGLQFYAKPDFLGNSQAIKAFLASRVKGRQFDELEKMISDLEAYYEIETIRIALADKRFIVSEKKVLGPDAKEITSCPDNIISTDRQSKDLEAQAKYIFSECRNNPEFRSALYKLAKELAKVNGEKKNQFTIFIKE